MLCNTRQPLNPDTFDRQSLILKSIILSEITGQRESHFF